MKVTIYDVVVQLGGSRDHEVLLRGVTPQEIEVLRQVHGIDAVPRGWRRGSDKVGLEELREQFVAKYGEAPVRTAFPSGVLPELDKARRLRIVSDDAKWSDTETDEDEETPEEKAKKSLAAMRPAAAKVMQVLAGEAAVQG